MYTQNEHEIEQQSTLALGQALKVEREKSSILLQDIAERTRLSSAHLLALEAGDFESLPGVGYIPGYIRNYCQAVGIDAAPHIASFKALSNDVTKKPEYSFPVQALVPRVAGSMVAMFAVLIGLAVYIGWTVLGYNQAPDNELIASTISKSDQPVELIESEAELLAQPERSTVQPSFVGDITDNPVNQDLDLKLQPIASQQEARTELAAAQQTPLFPEIEPMQNKVTPEMERASQETRTPLATTDNLAEPALAPAAEPTLTGVAAQATSLMPEKEVTIKATASAWIEVTRADGEVLVSQLMRNGDELVLPTNDDLFLSTGNAGGLRLEMLDLSAFDAGQTGEILRDLRLNRESLMTRQTQLTY